MLALRQTPPVASASALLQTASSGRSSLRAYFGTLRGAHWDRSKDESDRPPASTAAETRGGERARMGLRRRPRDQPLQREDMDPGARAGPEHAQEQRRPPAKPPGRVVAADVSRIARSAFPDAPRQTPAEVAQMSALERYKRRYGDLVDEKGFLIEPTEKDKEHFNQLFSSLYKVFSHRDMAEKYASQKEMKELEARVSPPSLKEKLSLFTEKTAKRRDSQGASPYYDPKVANTAAGGGGAGASSSPSAAGTARPKALGNAQPAALTLFDKRIAVDVERIIQSAEEVERLKKEATEGPESVVSLAASILETPVVGSPLAKTRDALSPATSDQDRQRQRRREPADAPSPSQPSLLENYKELAERNFDMDLIDDFFTSRANRTGRKKESVPGFVVEDPEALKREIMEEEEMAEQLKALLETETGTGGVKRARPMRSLKERIAARRKASPPRPQPQNERDDEHDDEHELEQASGGRDAHGAAASQVEARLEKRRLMQKIQDLERQRLLKETKRAPTLRKAVPEIDLLKLAKANVLRGTSMDAPVESSPVPMLDADFEARVEAALREKMESDAAKLQQEQEGEEQPDGIGATSRAMRRRWKRTLAATSSDFQGLSDEFLERIKKDAEAALERGRIAKLSMIKEIAPESVLAPQHDDPDVELDEESEKQFSEAEREVLRAERAAARQRRKLETEVDEELLYGKWKDQNDYRKQFMYFDGDKNLPPSSREAVRKHVRAMNSEKSGIKLRLGRLALADSAEKQAVSKFKDRRRAMMASAIKAALLDALANDNRTHERLRLAIETVNMEVSDVRVSQDYKLAKVYWRGFKDVPITETEIESLLAINSPHLRFAVQQTLNFKYAPELRFVKDTTDVMAKEIADVLQQATDRTEQYESQQRS